MSSVGLEIERRQRMTSERDGCVPNAQPWWVSEFLQAGPTGLELEGVSIVSVAERSATPVYIYSANTIRSQLARLRDALGSVGAPARIFYAMKANRFAPVLATVRREQDIGIDTCSPREVMTALGAGFAAHELSLTAGMLSNRDLDCLVELGVHVNLDSFSALRRYAARAPGGTRVGLRIDPAVSIGYGGDPKMSYGNSKFGFPQSALPDAVAEAQRLGLCVDTLHMHCGWSLQQSGLQLFDWALQRLAELASTIATLETVNVGGGLGIRYREQDQPIQLEQWADRLKSHLRPLGMTVACEPGTFVVANAGVLVSEVNTVEERYGVTWAGVNAGFAVNLLSQHYGIPMEAVKVADPYAPPTQHYNIAGNINESVDVIARQRALPALQEGDLLALLPAGAYGSSMSSDHCLRGQFEEVIIDAPLSHPRHR